jgi:flagellar motor switch protein FliG
MKTFRMARDKRKRRPDGGAGGPAAVAPFGFLQQATAQSILPHVQDEHPQTIAIILAHLRPPQAAGILDGLPSRKRMDVAKRLARMEAVSAETVRELAKELSGRMTRAALGGLVRAGGPGAVAAILNHCARAAGQAVLEGLEAEDPGLAGEVRRLMFGFEDLLRITDRGIQRLLKEMDADELSLALKMASEALKDKIFRNQSERAAAMIRDGIELLGPVRAAEVEAAQQRVVETARRLERSGEIAVDWDGEEEVYV